MFEPFIRPYLVKFCSKVSVDELCELITNGKDVYQRWLEEFSDGDKPPGFAYMFEGTIREEVKRIMAEVSPEHARLFDANPAWTERQLEGLMNELLK